MPSRRYRLIALVMALLAIAAFFLLPFMAARVVRGQMEASGAADRVAYASGASPWSWRFREADDLVAARVFGDGSLAASEDGLRITAGPGGRGEIGFPLTRQADLRRLNLLRVDASAPPGGAYGLVVRPILAAPLVRTDLADVMRPIPLDRLPWRDATGAAVAAPQRAAMLRLAYRLPPGATLVLRSASLARAGSPLPENGIDLPSGMTAEGLLHWSDQQRAIDPLVTFGDAAPSRPVPAWLAWLAPGAYLVLLVAGGIAARRREGITSPRSDLFDAALSVAGPLWFIAGMGLSAHPAPSAVAMFAGGVLYGAYLAWIRALPRWHWRGGWRLAGWPLVAIPVALGIAAVAGHAPVWPPFGRALLYIGWAFFQQWLMLAVVGGLLARALPRPAAVFLVALVFALLHTPNGLLMQLCFVAELGWAWWYLHQRALLPVAVAHAAAAVIMQACMAGGVLRSLEVSARYLM